MSKDLVYTGAAVVALWCLAPRASAQDVASDPGVDVAAFKVVITAVLDDFHDRDALPDQPRLVLSSNRTRVSSMGGPPTIGGPVEARLVGPLAEGIGARVAPLDAVRDCPADGTPGCKLVDGVDAIVSIGEMEATPGAPRPLIVQVTYAASDSTTWPSYSEVYRVDVEWRDDKWVVIAMKVVGVT